MNILSESTSIWCLSSCLTLSTLTFGIVEGSNLETREVNAIFLLSHEHCTDISASALSCVSALSCSAFSQLHISLPTHSPTVLSCLGLHSSAPVYALSKCWWLHLIYAENSHFFNLISSNSHIVLMVSWICAWVISYNFKSAHSPIIPDQLSLATFLLFSTYYCLRCVSVVYSVILPSRI